MTFGEFLETEFMAYQNREGKPRKWKDFAEWLRVRDTSLSQWKNGERLPDVENLKKLARRLGTQVYRYAGLSDADLMDMEVENSVLRRIMPLFRNMPRDYQERVADYVVKLADENAENARDEARGGTGEMAL